MSKWLIKSLLMLFWLRAPRKVLGLRDEYSSSKVQTQSPIMNQCERGRRSRYRSRPRLVLTKDSKICFLETKND